MARALLNGMPLQLGNHLLKIDSNFALIICKNSTLHIDHYRIRGFWRWLWTSPVSFIWSFVSISNFLPFTSVWRALFIISCKKSSSNELCYLLFVHPFWWNFWVGKRFWLVSFFLYLLTIFFSFTTFTGQASFILLLKNSFCPWFLKASF